MKSIYPLIKLLRPQQWLKNGFVFLPMFFSGNLLNAWCWMQTLLAFLAFSFMASAIYCLNDIRDVEADRSHPRKCSRPIASGEIPIPLAWAAMAGCVGLSVSVGVLCGYSVALVIAGYFLLNILYCYKLKHIAIIDVFVIAVGFVLRLLAGSMACRIWLSPWIVSLTFLLALFLAFAKRRDDVILMEETGVVVRKNIVRYNRAFLDLTLGLIGAMTMMSYVMYTVSPEVVARLGCSYVYVTSVFVLAGVLRYLQLALVDCKSGSPTKVLVNDRFIRCCVMGWLISFAIILYL